MRHRECCVFTLFIFFLFSPECRSTFFLIKRPNLELAVLNQPSADQLVSLAFCPHTICCCACFGLPPRIRAERLLRVGQRTNERRRSASKDGRSQRLRSSRRPETGTGFHLKCSCVSQLCECLPPGVDSCVQGHDCQHVCVTDGDSYLCRCHEGFVLNADQKTCTRKHFDSYLCISCASDASTG